MERRTGPATAVTRNLNALLGIPQKKQIDRSRAKTLFLLGLLILTGIVAFHPFPVKAESTLAIRPHAAGTFSEWDPVGDSPNYRCVDEEARDDDATYVRDAAGRKSDSYTLQDPTISAGNITNVRVVVWAYDAAGPENVRLSLVVDGTEYLSDKQTLTGSYVQYTADWAQNPATSTDWTWLNIDALEAGINSVATGKWTGDLHVTQIYVEVTYIPPPLRDVAIVSVTSFPLEVNAGQVVNITVVAENQGAQTETFNVTAYYNSIPIDTTTIFNLPSGANLTTTFNWNTTSISEGSYTIKAVATVVPGEVDVADNTYVDGTVTIVRPIVAVHVSNPIIYANSADTFDVNVTVSDVVSLYSWQAGLTFNPDVLEALSFVEGPFLRQGGNTIFINGTIDNAAGVINYHACSLTDGSSGVSGQGTLGTITFRIRYYGDSTLTLTDIILLDSTPIDIPQDLADSVLHVRIPGDANGDRIVDVSDLAGLGRAYGSDPLKPNWNPECDFDKDYTVDASDLSDIDENYGETW